MKNKISIALVSALILLTIMGFAFIPKSTSSPKPNEEITQNQPEEYWFLLQRKSKNEFFYKGIPGDKEKSVLIKTFKVNVGINGERPTPLPQLMNKEYWNITAKFETTNDPETSPYFLTLDIPWPEEWPYGPSPYNECNGNQCDWVRPGPFGLHGIAGNPNKLTDNGSSGCIRHTDEEISYLFNQLDPSEQSPIRYYIDDV